MTTDPRTVAEKSPDAASKMDAGDTLRQVRKVMQGCEIYLDKIFKIMAIYFNQSTK